MLRVYNLTEEGIDWKFSFIGFYLYVYVTVTKVKSFFDEVLE